MDAQKLKAKMARYMSGNSYNSELERVLHVTQPTAISRLKGRSSFTLEEIQLLKSEYDLTLDDIAEIFFENEESNNESERSCTTTQ